MCQQKEAVSPCLSVVSCCKSSDAGKFQMVVNSYLSVGIRLYIILGIHFEYFYISEIFDNENDNFWILDIEFETNSSACFKLNIRLCSSL